MAGQYQSFRGIDLGSGVNLKHDPALVGPLFAQKADNVGVDRDTVASKGGANPLTRQEPLVAGITVGDKDIHYGYHPGNSPGPQWQNIFGPDSTTSGFNYFASDDATVDVASPVSPTGFRTNFGPVSEHMVIPYHGHSHTAPLATGFLFREGYRLDKAFDASKMRPGQGFTVYQVGGHQTDRQCSLAFGFQLVSGWPGYATGEGSSPSDVPRGNAKLVPFLLVNDGATEVDYARKLMFDFSPIPGRNHVYAARLSSTGVSLFVDGTEVTQYGSTYKFDTGGANFQLCESSTDRPLSYGVGLGDRAAFVGLGSVFSTYSEAFYGVNEFTSDGTNSTTTIQTTGLAAGSADISGWMCFCRTGTNRNAEQYRWVSSAAYSSGTTTLTFDEPWDVAPASTDTFEVYPVVWSRLERASVVASYQAKGAVGDVMAAVGDFSDAEIQSWGTRSLDQEEIDAISGLLYYHKPDFLPSGTVKDYGPYGQDMRLAGTLSSGADGVFLDGSMTSLRTRWGKDSATPNRTVSNLMSLLLAGNGVTSSGASNKQFGFRFDVDIWNAIPDYCHMVIAQQGTEDADYSTTHVLTDYGNLDIVGRTTDAWVWQIVLTSGKHNNGIPSNAGEQQLHLYFRDTDPSNQSTASSTINEFHLALDLNAAGFDASGKTLSIAFGLLNTNADYNSPSAAGRLWMRVNHNGNEVIKGQTTVNFSTAPNGNDRLTSPFDEIVIGRALMPMESMQGNPSRRFGDGFAYAPLIVRGAWVLPTTDTYGRLMEGANIEPGVGTSDRFLGPLQCSENLIDITNGSSSVKTYSGDDFGAGSSHESGEYGLSGRYLYIPSLSKEYQERKAGTQEYWPLYQIGGPSGDTLSLAAPLAGSGASGVKGYALAVAFGGRAIKTETPQVIPIRNLSNEQKGFEDIRGALVDEGDFGQSWSLSVQGGVRSREVADGVMPRYDAAVTGIGEYTTGDGERRLVVARNGVFGEEDDGWRSGSRFSGGIWGGNTEDISYHLAFKTDKDGNADGTIAETPTGLDLSDNFTIEADGYLDDLAGKKTIHALVYNEGGAYPEEGVEGRLLASFYIEDGVPKFAIMDAATNGEAVWRAPGGAPYLNPGEWATITFEHSSTQSEITFYVNGRDVGAELESSSFSSYAPSWLSYTRGEVNSLIGSAHYVGRGYVEGWAGGLSRLAFWNSRKRAGEFSLADVMVESTTDAAMYLQMKEGIGVSLEDSSLSGLESHTIISPTYRPFFSGPEPEGNVSLTPFGGGIYITHLGILPQVWDGDEVLPVGYSSMEMTPTLELVTENIGPVGADTSDGVNDGNGSYTQWDSQPSGVTDNGYLTQGGAVTDPCGLNVDWSSNTMKFGGRHWLEGESDTKFSLGDASDQNVIVLQGWVRPLSQMDADERMIIADAREGARDGWGLETHGRKLRFEFWDTSVNAHRYVETKNDVFTPFAWHYIYFRYKVKPASATGGWDPRGSASAWSDVAPSADSMVVVNLEGSWTYEHSIPESDLDLGVSYPFASNNAPTRTANSLRIGGNPLTEDPYEERVNFNGIIDTIQGQVGPPANIVIERRFDDSDWAGDHTDAAGSWSTGADAIPDIARPTVGNTNEIWAWSYEELESGKSYALSRVNIGSGTPGSCTIDQEGSFLEWRLDIKSSVGVANAEGTHQFAVTFFDPDTGMESPASGIATAQSADSGGESTVTIAHWRVSGIPTFPGSERTWRRVYKTLANGESLLLATTLKDNTTTEVDLAPSEAFLQAQEELRTDVSAPPICGFTEATESAMFYGGIKGDRSTVVFSDAYKPWAITEGNSVLDESGDGRAITGFHYFRGSMVMFGSRDVYALTLRDYGYTLVRMSGSSGLVGHGAVADDGEEMLVIGSRGFYRGLSASAIRYEGWQLEDFFDGEFDSSQGAKTSVVYHSLNGVVYVAVPTKGSVYPVTVLRGYKNDRSMGASQSYQEARTSRYTWTLLRGQAVTALAQATDVDGRSVVVAGDPFGGLSYLEAADTVGVVDKVGDTSERQLSKSLPILSYSGSTLVLSATCRTAGRGLSGATVNVNGDVSRIRRNTGSILYLDKSVRGISPTPVAHIGGLERAWQSGWLDFSTFEKRKRAYFLDIQTSSATSGRLKVRVYADFMATPVYETTEEVSLSSLVHLPIGGVKARYISVEISSSDPDETFEVVAISLRLASNADGAPPTDQR